jgi:putative mRNA 3-end processing factor
VLGAAQLVVDHPGGRFVYTGDYGARAGATHAAGEPVVCDELVIESTFALPIFRFPSAEATAARIVAFCRDALAEAKTPVLLVHALGAAQEIVARLNAADMPVLAHEAVFRACEAYEALGRDLGVATGRVRLHAAEAKGRKRRADAAERAGVIVAPPGAEKKIARGRDGVRVAYLSGLSLIDAAIERRRADAGFAWSTHADHDDLVALVRAASPKRVHTACGDAVPLALVLREAGFDATPLPSPAIDVEEET